MDETLYKIEFDGELSEGYEEEEVKNELRNRFKLDEKKISRMFSGDPLILKKGIVREDAEKFIQSFLNIGVVCTLHLLAPIPESLPEDMVPPVEKSVSPPIPPAPELLETAEDDEEITLLRVRDVLGFTRKGLINPESDIQLVESEAQVSANEGISSELSEFSGEDPGIIEPQSELLEVEKSPGPEAEMIPVNEMNEQQEPRFRIVFAGGITEGQNQDVMKQSLARLLGIETEDTNILFSDVPVVLKDNLVESRAIQYRDQYQNTGAEVIMESSDNRVGGYIIE